MDTEYNRLKSKADLRLFEHAQMWHYEQTGIWVDEKDSVAFWEMYQKWVEFAFAEFIG